MHGSTNAIEVRNLAKGYKGVPVLDDVSLTVGRGTVFALLGANGSGKTTTINVLTTLIDVDGGTARVAGFDVAEQPAKVREQISVTGQFAAVDQVLMVTGYSPALVTDLANAVLGADALETHGALPGTLSCTYALACLSSAASSAITG